MLDAIAAVWKTLTEVLMRFWPKSKRQLEAEELDRRTKEAALADRAAQKDLEMLANQFQFLAHRQIAEAGMKLAHFQAEFVQRVADVTPERAEVLIRFMLNEGRIRQLGRDTYEFARDKSWRPTK
jgi:hypothetical protein